MDGRYKEQRKRLSGSKIKNIFYLVEGSIKESNKHLNTSLFNTQMFSRFTLIRTNTIQESVVFLTKIYKKLKLLLETQFAQEEIEFQKTFESFQKEFTKTSN